MSKSSNKVTQECFNQIVNSETVVWILDLIKKNIDNKHLSCISSLTLLGIVENHEIEIEYQQQAINKSFNQIFQRMEIFHDQDDSSPDQTSQMGYESEQSESEESLLDDSSVEDIDLDCYDLDSCGSPLIK